MLQDQEAATWRIPATGPGKFRRNPDREKFLPHQLEVLLQKRRTFLLYLRTTYGLSSNQPSQNLTSKKESQRITDTRRRPSLPYLSKMLGKRKSSAPLPPPKKRRKPVPAIEEIQFDASAREDYLTGFHKRKLQRIKNAKEEAAKKEREEKIQARKLVSYTVVAS